MPKIFVVGLSRTGTTSMAAALDILGYKVIHYPDTEDTMSKALVGLFNWDVLDQFDAFADTPVAAHFRQLDVQCPDSKFILTTRALDPWLSSCKQKIRSKPMPPKANPLVAAYVNSIRAILYGVTYFDEAYFKRAYSRHQVEVEAYFKNRSNLLTMDVKEGWEPLCTFLGCEVPDKAFPHKKRSKGEYK